MSAHSRIQSYTPLQTPSALLKTLPILPNYAEQITQTRTHITQIIHQHDPRLLIIIGPCSIHDPLSALEYAGLLQKAAAQYRDDLCIVMRVYFEKPRTRLGWKGLISDPKLDGSFDVNLGLHSARKLLLDLAAMNVPAGTEFLDTFIPSYISDLISWGAIGARTSESQIHRELASGLPVPVGFKNSTDGNIKIAVDAASVARHPHFFLGMNAEAEPSIIHTKGNESCHVILRGSHSASNYSAQQIAYTQKLLTQAKLTTGIVIDCNHGNSQKNYLLQHDAIHAITEQIQSGNKLICGVMLESHLVAGNQTFDSSNPLTYGQSITDACLAWDDTLPLLEKLALASKKRSSLSSTCGGEGWGEEECSIKSTSFP